MAKIVTKFKFLKPDSRHGAGGYAKYIATREGVEKIDDTQKLAPATLRQQQLIAKMVKDFPDSKDSLEYEDYLQKKTIGTASEFITRTVEENADRMMDSKTYADYIATRPRAERFGSHGLFTDDGEQVKLGEVSDELNNHSGNVWTAIISIRREDAERLGFNKGERWRGMLRTHTEALATNLNIPMSHLRWYAAFHNESHHPHVHLIAYSTEPTEGFLTKDGVNNLRSAFAKDIFAQDLHFTYEKQTEHRDALRLQSREIIAEIVSKINDGSYDNPKVEAMLSELAERLSKTSGKKQYGYLKSDVKAIVNNIVSELAADERISALYDLWYEQREEVLRTYTEEMPERVDLVDNTEFKSIKNAAIQEAMNIVADRVPMEDDEPEPTDEAVPEPAESEVEVSEPPPPEPPPTEYDRLKKRAADGNMWAQYKLAKLLLDREDEHYDPKEAVEWLIESAKQNNTVAKYKLGKMFLRGEDVAKNTDYALRWLEDAVGDGNQYAEYLLGKTLLRGEDTEQDLTRAADLLKRSSDKGNRYAKYTLGKALLDGNPLVQNIPDAIKLLTDSANAGFASAQYILGKLLYKGEIIPKDISRAVDYLEQAATQKNPYAAYLAGKIRLTEESVKDVSRAIVDFEIAAENGNHFAEYQLGKLYLYGKEVERDYDKGIAYLSTAAEHGNQYAAQLLHSIRSNKNWSAAMGTLRLLHHMSRLIQNRLEEERRGKEGTIDRKLRRTIDEKKQAHGLRQG